jgi:hypothetical protein
MDRGRVYIGYHLINRTYAVVFSNAALPALRQAQDERQQGTFHFICSSFWPSASAKTNDKKKEKYRCA